MPFKEMLKPSPISRNIVISRDFNYALPWRLDASKTSVCKFKIWEAMLETLHICLDSVYLVLMRTVTCLFMRLDLENQFLLKILLLYFYEFHCDFVKPDNVICERGEIYLHVLWARVQTLQHVSALLARKNYLVVQCCPRFKANTIWIAILGCCSQTWHILCNSHSRQCQRTWFHHFPSPAFLKAWLGRKLSVCASKEPPTLRKYFCYVFVARLQSKYHIPAIRSLK